MSRLISRVVGCRASSAGLDEQRFSQLTRDQEELESSRGELDPMRSQRNSAPTRASGSGWPAWAGHSQAAHDRFRVARIGWAEAVNSRMEDSMNGVSE